MSELQSILARRLSRLNEVGENTKPKVEQRDESPNTVIDVTNNNTSIVEKIEEGVGDSKNDHTSKPLSVGDNDYQDAIWASALARYDAVADVVVDDRFAVEDDIENGIMNSAESDMNVGSDGIDEVVRRSCDNNIQEEATYDTEEEEVDDTNNGNVIDNDTITSATTINTKRYVFSEEDASNRILSIAKREVNEKKELREVDKLLLESEEIEVKANSEESSRSRRRRPLVICLIVTLVVIVAVVVSVVASKTGKSNEEENVKESAMVTMIDSEEPSYSSIPSSSPSLTFLPTISHSLEPSNPAPSHEPTTSKPSLSPITLKPRTKEPSISPTLKPTTDSPSLLEMTSSPTVDALGITTSPSVIISPSPTVSCESYMRKKACLRPRKVSCEFICSVLVIWPIHLTSVYLYLIAVANRMY